MDVEFAEEELSPLPICSVQRQADSGGCTIWCRSKAVAEVVLTRLRGISYQGRTLEIFKLAGALMVQTLGTSNGFDPVLFHTAGVGLFMAIHKGTYSSGTSFCGFECSHQSYAIH